MKIKVNTVASEKLKVVHWADTITDAAGIMDTYRIRHLPVVDDHQHIIGIISDRDVRDRTDSDELVRGRMHSDVVTVEEELSVSEAANKMINLKVSSLLVTSGGYVTGIVTTEDLMKLMAHEQISLAEKFKDQIESTLYNSSIGKIVQSLANAGI